MEGASTQLDGMVEKLVSTDKENMRLKLDLNVLAEKILKQEEELKQLRAGTVDSKFEKEFPCLGGENVVKTYVHPTWSNVASQNRSKDAVDQLKFVEPECVDGKKIATVINTEVDGEIRWWEKAVVVYVFGARPPFNAMKQFTERRWGSFGVNNVCLLKRGVYIVELQAMEARIRVLEAGPWYFDFKPLIVKAWTPEVSLEREGLASVPIWVKLPGLKLHLWSTQSLSKIASLIGRPQYMMKAKRSRLAYARVCVEIDIGCKLPEVVSVMEPDGAIVEQVVEYERVPMQCKVCSKFGHDEGKCIKKPMVKQVWQVKQKVEVPKEVAVQEVAVSRVKLVLLLKILKLLLLLAMVLMDIVSVLVLLI